MANDGMREFWKVGAPGWVEHREMFDRELAAFADEVLSVAQPGPGDRVLDVGCGTGILLARATAAGAEGVGVDISTAMIDAATDLVAGARFVVADAQTDDLAALGPFSKVISRFGVMFFDDPVTAFANIRSACATDASLTFACWRSLEENQMFTLGTSVLAAHLDPAPTPPPPGAPGPMALADPVRLEGILERAGWADVAIRPFDAVCDYGRDGSDGVEERLTMVLNTGMGRVASEQLQARLSPEAWNAVLDEIRDELRAHLVDGSVRFTGATWLVTGRNPG